MAENLSNHNIENRVEPSSPLAELENQRADFVSGLVGSGLISDDLANSGELDTFIIDEATSYDALQHILVGDSDGGAHHLPTVFGLDAPEYHVVAASRLTGSRKMSDKKLRERQSVRQNGTFHPGTLIINGQQKEFGSAMFPSEWTTEQVIRSIITTSRTAPEKHDLERATYTHLANLDGVDIRVITSEKNGKIITGYPVIPKKDKR